MTDFRIYGEPPLGSIVVDRDGDRWERRVIDYGTRVRPDWASDSGWYPLGDHDGPPAFTPPLSFGRLVMLCGPVDFIHTRPGETS